MRLVAVGCVLMLIGLATLFAIVVNVLESGLFLSLAAYSLLIVGLLLSGAGISTRFNR
jgi:hypothetical protein